MKTFIALICLTVAALFLYGKYNAQQAREKWEKRREELLLSDSSGWPKEKNNNVKMNVYHVKPTQAPLVYTNKKAKQPVLEDQLKKAVDHIASATGVVLDFLNTNVLTAKASPVVFTFKQPSLAFNNKNENLPKNPAPQKTTLPKRVYVMRNSDVSTLAPLRNTPAVPRGNMDYVVINYSSR